MADSCMRTQRYNCPCGSLLLAEHEGRLCLCDWLNEPHHLGVIQRLCHGLHAGLEEGDSPTLQQARLQLDEYFGGQRRFFSVPLLFIGSDFRKAIWQELINIPWGETLSYGELARRFGKPSAVRAVANACGANALSVFVPCHRVIGSNHRLTGYGGGLKAKRYLLDLESMCLFNMDKMYK